MRIDSIYLDLDDVLNDFTREALQHVTGLSEFTHEPEWGYDIVLAAGKLCTKAQVQPAGSISECKIPPSISSTFFTQASFWGQIKRDFWANIGVTDWCYELIDICASAVGKENVCILTSPTLDPDCVAGKMEWIQKEMPTWLHRQFLIGPCKQFCARPGSLLIDDCEENVRKFRERGGLAWEFPRPWNSQRSSDPQEWVETTKIVLATLTGDPYDG